MPLTLSQQMLLTLSQQKKSKSGFCESVGLYLPARIERESPHSERESMDIEQIITAKEYERVLNYFFFEKPHLFYAFGIKFLKYKGIYQNEAEDIVGDFYVELRKNCPFKPNYWKNSLFFGLEKISSKSLKDSLDKANIKIDPNKAQGLIQALIGRLEGKEQIDVKKEASDIQNQYLEEFGDANAGVFVEFGKYVEDRIEQALTVSQSSLEQRFKAFLVNHIKFKRLDYLREHSKEYIQNILPENPPSSDNDPIKQVINLADAKTSTPDNVLLEKESVENLIEKLRLQIEAWKACYGELNKAYPKRAHAVWLRDHDGLEYEDMAEHLKNEEGTVRQTVRRGRQGEKGDKKLINMYYCLIERGILHAGLDEDERLYRYKELRLVVMFFNKEGFDSH